MCSLRRFIFCGGAAVFVCAYQAGADPITTRLPAAPGFSWTGTFGVRGGYVKQYRQLNGAAGGMVIPFTMNVFDNDPDPNEKDPLVNGMEKIGTLDFEFVLTQESQNAAGPVIGVGAALFGGFDLTDLSDAGTRFSFLQTVSDTNTANHVDGGGFRGMVNDDIPGYNGMPGWNYQGTQYDYFDNPFRSSRSGMQTVSFETALDCYTPNNEVHVLADFTWSFTSDGRGDVTGTAPTAQKAASNALFNAYTNKMSPPGPQPAGNTPSLLQNIGVGGCHDFATQFPNQPPVPRDIPEPAALLLLAAGFMMVVAARITLR